MVQFNITSRENFGNFEIYTRILDHVKRPLLFTRESYVDFFPETQLLFWSSLSYKGIAQYLDTKIW